jgi:hypothetical protein
MREPEERVTVVETGGGGGAGVIAGIVGALVAVLILLYLFGGNIFGGSSGSIDVDVDLPEAPVIETPAE